MRQQAIDRALEVAPVMGDASREIVQYRCRHVEAGVMRPRRGNPRFQNAQAQFFAKRSHLDYQTTSEPGANAVVEAFEIGWRPVRCDHHLAAGIDQRVQRVAEFGLGRFALQELQVIDHQHVDAAQRLFERQRGLGLQRRDKTVHEFLGGEIEHLALGAGIAGPGHRLQQMGLAEADAGMDVQRIEHHAVAAPSFRDLTRRGMRQRIGAADHKASEGEARIER